VPNPWLLACCGVAILCTLASLALYRRARKPWYVVLNLLANGGWAVMTVCIAGIIAFAFAGVKR
jgi:hypothetical protein